VKNEFDEILYTLFFAFTIGFVIYKLKSYILENACIAKENKFYID